MSEIADLERRITRALERIGQGLDNWPAPQEGTAAAEAPAETAAQASTDAEAEAEIVRLNEELVCERDAAAQLHERLRAVKSKQDGTVADLERKLAEMTRQLDVQGLELQRMRKTNIQLRETIRTLREAMAQQLSEPHLVNKSMLAELEALRASRMAEMAEMDEILGGLEPLIGRVAGAAETVGEGGTADA